MYTHRHTIQRVWFINKCCRGCGEKGTLLYYWWECRLIQSLWRTEWRFPKKLKIKLPYDPAIPLLGIYPEKTIIQKDTCTSMFTAALFAIFRTWKQPRCMSTHEQIKKLCYTYTYHGIVKVEVTQSHPTLCDPMDYTVHGILQARILEWVAFTFFRGSSQPRD